MRKSILFVLLLVFAICTLSAENFYIKNYDIIMDVAPNGKIRIKETIDVYFTEPSHGIMRDIQDYFENDKQAWDPIVADVDIIEATDLHSIDTEGDYTTLALGDPNKLITGDKRYSITYDYDLGYDRYEDYDELYYNIVSAAWGCSMDNVTYSITLPFAENINGIWITAGDFMSSDLSSYTLSEDGRTITGSYSNLGPYQAITIRVEMAEGYYQGQVIPIDNTNLFLTISIASSIILLLITILLFFKYGKDDELIVKAEFHPPFDMTPMDLGYILDNRLDNNKEVTAMLFYWADKGYIKIEEEQKDLFKFHKIKELDSSAKEADKKLFDAIFNGKDIADAESMAKNNFTGKVAASVFPRELKYFSGEKALSSNASKRIKGFTVGMMFIYTVVFGILCSTRYLGALTTTLMLIGILFNTIISLLGSNFNRTYHLTGTIKKGLSLLPGIILSLLVLVIITAILSDIAPFMLGLAAAGAYVLTIFGGTYFAMLMERRSKYGQMVLEGALGYREFIDLVEVDKLKLLIDEDPEIFYHTLSYAMAFGLEEKWAKKFKGLYIPAPSWYISPTPIYDAYFYSRMSRRWRQVYTENVIANAPAVSGGGGRSTFSGSSGFAGGGFSGGGGRSW